MVWEIVSIPLYRNILKKLRLGNHEFRREIQNLLIPGVIRGHIVRDDFPRILPGSQRQLLVWRPIHCPLPPMTEAQYAEANQNGNGGTPTQPRQPPNQTDEQEANHEEPSHWRLV